MFSIVSMLTFLKFQEKVPVTFMANVLDCDLFVNEFKLQLRYYVHFRTNTLGKCMNLFISQLWVKWYRFYSSTGCLKIDATH